MKGDQLHRRRFLKQASVGAAGLTAAAPFGSAKALARGGTEGTLAVLGGQPVRKEPFPSWPVIEANDREAWQKVLEEGKWCRLDGQYANRFEKVYAEHLGARHCLATANGTSALLTALNVLGVGPGDEVILPPYTFVATLNVVLLQHALPIFVDSDRQTFQIDARKIEPALSARTICLLPVHLGGGAADIDAILTIAQSHRLPVVEDTCQSHLAEWQGKKLGSLGTFGCFSFQASKNLNSGEGGAVLTNDAVLAEKSFVFHNNGNARGGRRPDITYAPGGANLRMTEFQACLLLTQMSRLEEQSRVREENARYLTRQLEEIPGIAPARNYGGCTRNAYHLYMFRYDREQFAGASREQFLKALRAEGIPCSSGYTPLNKQTFVEAALESKAYKTIYGPERLRAWKKNNHCPENDRLCSEAVWFVQTMLLGKRSDMDQIAASIRKIHAHAGDLAKI
jgi:dTDP-4-amino-4,6-dideoxygalactose transaminase